VFEAFASAAFVFVYITGTFDINMKDQIDPFGLFFLLFRLDLTSTYSFPTPLTPQTHHSSSPSDRLNWP